MGGRRKPAFLKPTEASETRGGSPPSKAERYPPEYIITPPHRSRRRRRRSRVRQLRPQNDDLGRFVTFLLRKPAQLKKSTCKKTTASQSQLCCRSATLHPSTHPYEKQSNAIRNALFSTSCLASRECRSDSNQLRNHRRHHPRRGLCVCWQSSRDQSFIRRVHRDIH